MQYTCNADIFDHESMNRMNMFVQRLNATFVSRVQEVLEQILKYGAEIAQPIFGSACVVSYEINGFRGSLMADGEAVCFIEFGTGEPTNRDGNPYAGTVGIEVTAGSWSKEHAGTWDEWISNGNDPSEYPYNHEPHSAMYKACQAMVLAVRDLQTSGEGIIKL